MAVPDLDRLLRERLETLEQQRQRRRLRGIERHGTIATYADGRRLIDFSSNDYLGLSQHPRLIEGAIAWTRRHGAGSASARLITGTATAYLEIEQRLAAFKGTEAALIFASGFQANATILPALIELLRGEGEPLVFTDRLIHASLHHGLAAASIRQIRFRHNDLDHLDHLLAREAAKAGPRLIVTESVFSMDGDCCDLAALTELAAHHGALIYVDEAHATGVLGPQGRGLAAAVPGRVDIVMGTLGKALGGFGAYVAGSRALIDYLTTRCAGFVYSTALPPSVFGSLEAALEIVPTLEAERAALHREADRLRQAVQAAGFDCGPSRSQIVPVLLGEEEAALAMQRHLETAGLLGVAIRPPTVPAGGSRLRLSLSAAHTGNDIDRLIDAITAFG